MPVRSSRVLATIVFTDGVGYSARMQLDERHAIALIDRDLAHISAQCAKSGGRVLKNTGDGLLMYFGTAGQAVEFALKIQATFMRAAETLPPENVLQHRVGIHLGDVFLSEHDAIGDGVNIAARLLDQAEPGGICISQTVYDVVKNRLSIKATSLGPRELKNIREAVPVYQILVAAAADERRKRETKAARPMFGRFTRLRRRLRWPRNAGPTAISILKGEGIMGKTTWAAAILAAVAIVFANHFPRPTVSGPEEIAAAQPAASAIPSPSAQAKAEKTIKEIFKKEYAEKGESERQAFAQKLLQQGKETESDRAIQFVLFREARDIAASSGDASTAFLAIDEMAKTFSIDPLDSKATALATIASKVTGLDPSESLLQAGRALLESAAAADNFTVTGKLAPALESLAEKTGKVPLVVKTQARNQELRDASREFTRYKSATLALHQRPDDVTANLNAGRYLCFFKNDWSKGLSMLAKGSDATLKDLAAREIAKQDPATRLKLADGWWDEGGKQSDTGKAAARVHAQNLYTQAWPALTAADRSRVEPRLPQDVVQKLKENPNLSVASTPTPANVTEPTTSQHAAGSLREWKDAEGHRVIDLMSLIDCEKNSEDGQWKIEHAELYGEAAAKRSAMLAIPYFPPDEYDFRIEFTRTEGAGDVNQLLTHGEHQFTWMIGGFDNTVTRFEEINGTTDDSNPTAVKSQSALTNQRRYTSIVRVRKNEVSAELDGKTCARFQTDYSNLESLYWFVWGGGLGLGTYGSRTVYHKIQLIEISGRGQSFVAPKEDPQLYKTIGSSRPVGPLVFSPNAEFLSIYRTNVDEIWNIKLRQRMSSAAGSPPSQGWSPDGKLFMNGIGDLYAWPTLEPGPALERGASIYNASQFSADSSRIVVHGIGKPLRVFRTSDGLKVWEEKAPRDWLAFAISPNGHRVAASDAVLRVWDVDSGKELVHQEWNPVPHVRIVFSPDSKSLCIAREAGFSAIFDVDSGKELSHVNTPNGNLWQIEAIIASEKDFLIAKYVYAKRECWLWSARSGQRTFAIGGQESPWVFSPDARRILGTLDDNSVQLWDTETGAVLGKFVGHTKPIHALAFSADGKFAASDGDDQTVRVWRMP